MKVQVVSFYTPLYEPEVAKLRASLDELAVPYHLVPLTLEGQNVWKRAVMHKPRFILDELIALKDDFDGLFWTDADSILRRPPPWEAFDGCDVGYAKFRWTAGHAWEVLTGGLYFARKPHVAAFVQAWAAHTARFGYHDTPEQIALELTLKEWDQRIAGRQVSTDWVSIFDAPHEKGHRPTFEHFQASRRLRQ